MRSCAEAEGAERTRCCAGEGLLMRAVGRLVRLGLLAPVVVATELLKGRVKAALRRLIAAPADRSAKIGVDCTAARWGLLSARSVAGLMLHGFPEAEVRYGLWEKPGEAGCRFYIINSVDGGQSEQLLQRSAARRCEGVVTLSYQGPRDRGAAGDATLSCRGLAGGCQ